MPVRNWKRWALCLLIVAATCGGFAPKAHALIVICPPGFQMIPPGVCVPTPSTPAAQVQSSATPWVAIAFGAGVVSVMVNAAVIGQTQCREMTVEEAWTAAMLPFAGMLFNRQNSQCSRPVRRLRR